MSEYKLDIYTKADQLLSTIRKKIYLARCKDESYNPANYRLLLGIEVMELLENHFRATKKDELTLFNVIVEISYYEDYVIKLLKEI